MRGRGARDRLLFGSSRDALASVSVLEQHEALDACLKEEFQEGEVPVLGADHCSATEFAELRGASDGMAVATRALRR